MPRNLVTGFKKVATAGSTVDGREIKEQDLLDIAETYSEEDYTALIWPEHMRYFNMGKVKEVKAEEDSKSRLSLYVRLAPNEYALAWNKAEQKLYTSIEITPNFAKTGKAYLTGLAFTDSPASLGTQELRFSKIKETEDSYFSSPVQIDNIDEETPIANDDQASKDGLFKLLSNFFTQSTPNINQPDSEPQEDEMNDEQFNKLHDATTAQTEAFNKLATTLAATLDNGKEAGDSDAGGDDNSSETSSSKEFSELKSNVESLTKTVEDMNKNFSKLLEEEPGTPVPRGVGSQEDEQEILC